MYWTMFAMKSFGIILILVVIFLKRATRICSFQRLPIASSKVWTRNILKPTFPEHRNREMTLWGDAKEKKPKAAKTKSKGASADSSSSASASAAVSAPAKKAKGGGGGGDSPPVKAKTGTAKTAAKDGKEKEVKQKHVRSRTIEDAMARWERENQIKIKIPKKKVKDPEKSKLKNLPRKLRRHLKSCTIETFPKMIYNPLYEDYLKNRASENMYKILMKKIQRRAKQLMVDLDPEFAKRSLLAPNISDVLMHNETLSKFRTLVTSAGLEGLFLEGNKTAFIPVDAGMDKVFEGTKFDELLANNESARAFVRAHLLEGYHSPKRLREASEAGVKLLSLGETEIDVSLSDDILVIGRARGVWKKHCINGYVHMVSAPVWTP